MPRTPLGGCAYGTYTGCLPHPAPPHSNYILMPMHLIDAQGKNPAIRIQCIQCPFVGSNGTLRGLSDPANGCAGMNKRCLKWVASSHSITRLHTIGSGHIRGGFANTNKTASPRILNCTVRSTLQYSCICTRHMLCGHIMQCSAGF